MIRDCDGRVDDLGADRCDSLQTSAIPFRRVRFPCRTSLNYKAGKGPGRALRQNAVLKQGFAPIDRFKTIRHEMKRFDRDGGPPGLQAASERSCTRYQQGKWRRTDPKPTRSTDRPTEGRASLP